jgi:hypothetical protein
MKREMLMEAAGTSETSVNLYQTAWHNNPEDSHLYTHCHENLSSLSKHVTLKNV